MARLKISRFIGNIVLGANIATIILMLATGYSYLIDPLRMPIISLLGLVFPFFVVFNVLFMLFWTFFKWRNIIYSFVGLVICYVPVNTYFCINRSHPVPDDCLKVMSYNVLNYVGMSDNTLSRDSNELVFYLQRSDCDIICLQESNSGNLSEGMKKVLYENYPYHHEEKKKGGVQSILSKFQIVEVDSIPYPSDYNFSMAYRLKTDIGDLLVINNHFESNRFSTEEKSQFGNFVHGKMSKHEMKDETKGLMAKLSSSTKMRNPQAKAVAEYVKQHDGEHIILCGDFNEWPVSYTNNVIAKNLTDCYVAAGQGPGWSYNHDGMHIRIDNIMCSKDIIPHKCYVDNTVDFSDHFPIISYVQLPAKTAESNAFQGK